MSYCDYYSQMFSFPCHVILVSSQQTDINFLYIFGEFLIVPNVDGDVNIYNIDMLHFIMVSNK